MHDPVKLGGYLITGGGGPFGITADGDALFIFVFGFGMAVFLVVRAIRNRGKKPHA